MNPRNWLLVVLGVGMLMLSGGLEWAGCLLVQAQEPKTFQYKIVEATTDVGTMQRLLNDYGAAGWELVAVGLGDLTSPRLIFKR